MTEPANPMIAAAIARGEDYNLHLCIDTGPEVRWVALDRIKTMEPT